MILLQPPEWPRDRHVVEVECAEKSVEVLGQCVVVVAALWVCPTPP